MISLRQCRAITITVSNSSWTVDAADEGEGAEEVEDKGYGNVDVVRLLRLERVRVGDSKRLEGMRRDVREKVFCREGDIRERGR